MRLNVLVIDDIPEQRSYIADEIRGMEHDVFEAGDVPAAIAYLREHAIHVVFADIMLGRTNLLNGGLEQLQRVGMRSSRYLLMSSNLEDADLERADRTGKGTMVLAKPLTERFLRFLVNRMEEESQADDELAIGELMQSPRVDWIGRDPLKANIASTVDYLRRGPVNDPITALILGETGTGKEVVAQWIAGDRRCVSLNCAAFRDLEHAQSALFGHVAGAFPGARPRTGSFLLASGGVLFLDEIHLLDYAVQGLLLRALETKSILPLGADRPIAVTPPPQVIAAASGDLIAMLQKGTFQEALIARIANVRLELPPLRSGERRGDIAILARRFIQDTARTCLGPSRQITISDEAVALLQEYPWPRNVRELRAAMKVMVVRSLDKATIGVEDVAVVLQSLIPAGPPPGHGVHPGVDFERAWKVVKAQSFLAYRDHLLRNQCVTEEEVSTRMGLGHAQYNRLKSESREVLQTVD